MWHSASKKRELTHLSRLTVVAFILGLNSITSATAGPLGNLQAQPTLTDSPSALVIKVAGNATAKVALSGQPLTYGVVCFVVEGFPSSGFVTTFSPECSNAETLGSINSTLTVEATPAAAPQNFTAFVVAASGNWTENAPVSITVVPGLPAWVPWSIILLFVVVMMSPMLVGRWRRKGARS
jgi:hypothetical protein